MSEKILTMDLQLFADIDLNTQTTLSNDLSPEMKTFYSKDLIETAKAKLVHAQFAEHKPLPKHGGKEVEWRKWSSFKKALKPLEEGVTPRGSTLAVGTITKKVEEFGDYSTVTDVLELTAIDNVIVEVTSKHADNAGLTLDTIARNELITATQVIYAPVVTSSGVTEVNSRAGLTKDAKLTPELIAKAVTQDAFISVNGKNYLIQRGVEVTVPKNVRDVYLSSVKAAETADEYYFSKASSGEN